jgi:hypothetical protein
MSGMKPLEQHSRFGQNLLFAPTLYQAIMMFCAEARKELSNANFHIWREPETVWFCGGRVEGSEDEVQQVIVNRSCAVQCAGVRKIYFFGVPHRILHRSLSILLPFLIS